MNKQSEIEIAQRHCEAPRDAALRVNNLKSMKQFYQHVVGFKLLGQFPSAALLKVDDRSSDQIQMLALLQRSIGAGPERSAVGHIAFIISVEDHELEKQRLQSLGLRVDARNYERIGKRSLCFRDPEGNEVELLSRDPALDC